ncbi:hypothetical protein F2P56_011801 [Juglans regia]|uniref:DUF4283 domain-containing protein n=1 Tax=Juglans regia TaxID=51240 RepID=A0A833XTG1_JUGRE|nr:hypothetical protein F2P56_011801 [Juglans regia]
MGLCREVVIEQKVFEFRKENERWWRITESGRRVVKYISVDHEALGWLGLMVKECAESLGSSEFLRTRRKGNNVLMVRRGCNNNGSVIFISEFGHEKRRGLLVVPEGRKGEGWRNFGVTLKELSPPPSVPSVRNRVAKGGGAPSWRAAGALSYSEVLQAQQRAASAVVPGENSTEIVQQRSGDGYVLLGSKEENILRVLGDMEKKVGMLLDEIDWLKRSVKGKEILSLGMGCDAGVTEGRDLGIVSGQRSKEVGSGLVEQSVSTGLEMGPALGQVVGPKKGWRAKPQPDISAQGPSFSRPPMAPICAPPVALPAQKPAQKLPTASGEYSNEPILRRVELEDGEMELETLRVVFPSSSGGLLMGSAQTKPCLASEVPDAVSVGLPAEEGLLCDFLSPIRGLCLEKAQSTPCVVEGSPVANPVQRDSQSMEMVSVEENKSGGGFEGLKVPVPASGEPKSVCGSELDFFTPANTGEEGAILTPLCTLPPNYGNSSSKWVFKKVEEIQAIIGISFGGYEKQFKALLVALEDSHSKSASKRNRELKKLTCSINYDVKDGSSGRDRSRGRGNIVLL